MSANLLQVTHRPMYGKGQVVAYTGTAGSTSALPDNCNGIYVMVTSIAHVSISYGAAVVAATTADLALPASQLVFLPIERPTAPGVDGKAFVSAIQSAAGGNLHVTPCAD